MKVLDDLAFHSLLDESRQVGRTKVGIRWIRTGDGQFAKIFRRPKSLLSSDKLFPYARRFQRAALHLERRSIRTVDITDLYWVPSLPGHLVMYRPLDGEILRRALTDLTHRAELLQAFAGFFAQLHAKGIYFRGVHFGNVLRCSDGEFGLIDISSARFHRRALGPSARARNFKPLFLYEQDQEALQDYGLVRFLDRYLVEADLPGRTRRRLRRAVTRLQPFQELG